MTEILTAVSGMVRVVLAFLILLFIPGFGVTLAYFPDKSGISTIERLILSGVLSIGVVIFCGLFADFVLGIDTTPENILILLLGVTALSVIIWMIRRWHLRRSAPDGLSPTYTVDSVGKNRFFFRILGKIKMKISGLFNEKTL